jgi:hypothetical protein
LGRYSWPGLIACPQRVQGSSVRRLLSRTPATLPGPAAGALRPRGSPARPARAASSAPRRAGRYGDDRRRRTRRKRCADTRTRTHCPSSTTRSRPRCRSRMRVLISATRRRVSRLASIALRSPRGLGRSCAGDNVRCGSGRPRRPEQLRRGSAERRARPRRARRSRRDHRDQRHERHERQGRQADDEHEQPAAAVHPHHPLLANRCLHLPLH